MLTERENIQINPIGNNRVLDVMIIPEPTQQEIVSNMLSAFGNHEAKALTLALMDPGTIYTYSTLHTKTMRAQSGNPTWKMGRSVPFSYCEKSFAPIGLVAKQVLNSDLSTYGYEITDLGKTQGIAFAGHLLQLSLDHPDISLSQLLGATKSSGNINGTGESDVKRSPKTRVSIYRALLESNTPTRLIDVASKIQIDPSLLGRHLRDLGKSGIIKYDSKPADEPFTRFSRTAEERIDLPIPHPNFGSFTHEIFRIISTSPAAVTVPEIAQRMTENRPEREFHDIESMYGYISVISTFLEEQGFVIRNKFDSKTQSEIDLSPDQRELLSGLIKIIDMMQAQDPEFINEGVVKAKAILADPEKVKFLFAKAKSSSAEANKDDTYISADNILTILSGIPNMSTGEIQQQLHDRYGKSLSRPSLSRLLTRLANTGKVEVSDKRSATYWTLPLEN